MRLAARSENVVLPDGFWWNFKQLRQLTDEQKGQLATSVTQAVTQADQAGLVSKRIAAQELQQSSRRTGVFTNIDDDFLDQLDDTPPVMGEPGMMGMEGAEGYPGMEPGMESGGEGAEAGTAYGEPDGGGSQIPEDDAASVTRRRARHLHLHVADRDRLITYQGIPLYIETRAGEERVGLRGWATKMPCHYGFIRMTGSAEGHGEGMDVFLGETGAVPSDQVFVINQVHPETGVFDEHKVMLGFRNRMLALRAYQRAFSDGSGSARLGGVREMSVDQFKRWLTEADVRTAA